MNVVRYRFELATPQDDLGLRRVLRETPMDGKISVGFQREPSYFAGSVVEGPFRQVIVCRDDRTNEVVGFGTRSIRQVHINGSPAPVGYLGSLRILPSHRNLGLVARGFRFLRDLHADQRTELYLTTIAEGNERALATLTSGRAGLPRYQFAGQFYTFAIPIPRKGKQQTPPCGAVSFRPATRADIPAVVAFLNREGRRHQFLPKYHETDFCSSRGTFKDLGIADLILALDRSGIIGTLAGWDQRGYRQTIVCRYSLPLSGARPLYNAWASLAGRRPLPVPGQAFRYISAALPVVHDDRADVFDALLENLLSHLADRDADYLLVGFHETSPFVTYMKRRALASYVTRLYHVRWDEPNETGDSPIGRSTYLELGTL